LRINVPLAVCDEEAVALRPVHVVYKGGVPNIDVLGIHGCDAHVVVHGRDAPDGYGSAEHDVYAVPRPQDRHVFYLHVSAPLHIHPVVEADEIDVFDDDMGGVVYVYAGASAVHRKLQAPLD
jgi:hypothetical protein